MTREEAIELIGRMSMAFVPTDQYGDYADPEPYEQAVTMAIEALSDHSGEVTEMGDLISRQGAIKTVCRTRCGDKAKGCPAHSCPVIEEFDALQSADVVEIVRCKECKHTIIRPDGEIYCKKLDMEETPISHFCGWGERKDERSRR